MIWSIRDFYKTNLPAVSCEPPALRTRTYIHSSSTYHLSSDARCNQSNLFSSFACASDAHKLTNNNRGIGFRFTWDDCRPSVGPQSPRGSFGLQIQYWGINLVQCTVGVPPLQIKLITMNFILSFNPCIQLCRQAFNVRSQSPELRLCLLLLCLLVQAALPSKLNSVQ